eukprot:Nk52_evm41s279 gene=Nk52_evmTU41s279
MERYVEIVKDNAAHVTGQYRGFINAPYSMLEHWKATPQKVGLWEDFKEDFLNMFAITQNEILLIVGISIAITFIRITLANTFFQPLAKRYQLKAKEASKFPESGFKLIYYTILWSFAHYLLFHTDEHTYFQDPTTTWNGWSRGMYVEPKLYWLYMIQLGFYFHSIYATYFMDERRKDHYAMVIHHIVTIMLIGFSYCTRYHRVGLQVLYVHDFCDVCMEFAKCCVYFKVQNGKFISIFDTLANMFFVSFVFSWIYFRLYVFPCQVLVSTAYHSIQSYPIPRLYHFFNGLLWILLVLHVYWFMFIAIMVYRVLVLGQSADDNREEEVSVQKTKKTQ